MQFSKCMDYGMLDYQALFKQTKDINIDFAFAWIISQFLVVKGECDKRPLD